jgi:two-component system, sensor histidine kinase PdtaS
VTTLPRNGLMSHYEGQPLLLALASVLLRKHGPVFQIVFACAAFALAFSVRLAVDDFLPPGFPFLTFFPAVLIAALVVGVRARVLVAVVSGLASWFFFIEPVRGFAMNSGTAVAMLFYVLITGTELVFIAAIERALRQMNMMQAQTARLARGRELMLAEMQHRVSNNLATVAVLLRAQAGQMPDGQGREALGAAQQRIMTISRLQRRLHRPDQQDIELSSYLGDIARDAAEASGLGPDVINLEAQPLRVAQDQALPLGLIVCELLLNAFEHAAASKKLQVTVRLDRCPEAEGRIAVSIEDNGPGLPPGFDLATVDSLGLSVAQQFAEQMDGSLIMETAPNGGARARVVFTAQMPDTQGPEPGNGAVYAPALGGAMVP